MLQATIFTWEEEKEGEWSATDEYFAVEKESLSQNSKSTELGGKGHLKPNQDVQKGIKLENVAA